MEITYPPGIDALPLHKTRLEALCRAAMKEQQVLGMVIVGSFVTGTADVYSDLDLWLLTEDHDLEHVVGRTSDIAEESGPVVSAYTGVHLGDSSIFSVLYEDLIHADLMPLTLSAVVELHLKDPRLVLWERRNLSSVVWAPDETETRHDLALTDLRMWPWVWYTQSKILRGELYEAFDTINYMRTLVLFPLLRMTKGILGKESRRAEELIGERSDDFARTVPTLDREGALAALRQTVKLYLELIDPLLARDGQQPATAAREVVMEALAAGLSWQPPPVSSRRRASPL